MVGFPTAFLMMISPNEASSQSRSLYRVLQMETRQLRTPCAYLPVSDAINQLFVYMAT